MSQWTRAKINVNVNPAVLEKSLVLTAQRLQKILGKNVTIVKDSVATGFGSREDVDFLLKTDLPYGNGFGVKVKEDGKLELVGDFHGAGITSEKLASIIQNDYLETALLIAAQNTGLALTQVEEKEDTVLMVFEGGM